MALDRFLEAWRKAVRLAYPGIDFLAFYRARVIRQPTAQTLDLIPDDARLPPMSGIALRHGLPGVQVSVSPGAYVNVGWDGGDPTLPYCQLWYGVAEVVSEIKIAGSTPVARLGDTVSVTIPAMTVIPGVGTTSFALTVHGVITSGSNVLKTG